MIRSLLGLCFPFIKRFQGPQMNECYNMEYKGNHIYLSPKEEHEATLIWMHGLGDNAPSFMYIFMEENGLLFPKGLKLIFLQAPDRQVSINFGQVTSSWFDIKQFHFRGELDKLFNLKEVEESKQIIFDVLDQESQLIDSSKIFIGGFSQGCAMALHAGLNYGRKLGGIMGLSGFYFTNTEVAKVNQDLPIFLSHGTIDQMIPWLAAQQSYEVLMKIDKNVLLQPIEDLNHTIDQSQLAAMRTFLMAQLSDQQKVLSSTIVKENQGNALQAQTVGEEKNQTDQSLQVLQIQ